MVFIAFCFLNIFLSLLTTRWVERQAAIYLTLLFHFKELIICIFWWLIPKVIHSQLHRNIQSYFEERERKKSTSFIKITLLARNQKPKNRFLSYFLKKALAGWQFNKREAVGIVTLSLKSCLHTTIDLTSLIQTI